MSTVNNNSFALELSRMESRTISELCRIAVDHIYVYFRDKEVFNEFVRRALAEGLKCGSQDLHYTDIVALQPDGSAVCCNSVSRIAFGSGESITNNIVRIDFEKYIAWDRDFLYRWRK